jgi:Tol biopolymer transport system component
LRGPFGHIAVSASLAGGLAYRSGPVGRRHQFIWFDRSGKEIRKLGDRFDYAGFPSLSRDGRHVAFASTIDRNQDIVFLETARAATTRFTSDAGIDASPVWSPDNRRIAFASNRNGTFDTYLKDAGGAAAEDLFLAGYSPTDWSPDNRFLLCRKNDPKTSTDIWAVPLTGDRKPVPVVQTSFAEKDGQFSPDGKWIAYQSDESGRWEIYAQPFLGPGDKVPISTNGGGQVRWRRDGKELFYIGLDGRLMAVPVRFGPQTIEAGAPVALFATDLVPAVPTADWQQYVVSPDGKQFLVSTIVEEAVTSPITVILNWKQQ